MAGSIDFGYRNEKSFKHGLGLGLPPTNALSPGAMPVPADAISLAQMSKAFFSLCLTDIHMATSRGLAFKKSTALKMYEVLSFINQKYDIVIRQKFYIYCFMCSILKK